MCPWEDWDAQIPAVQLDSCGNSRGSEIQRYLHRKSQCSDFHNNFLLNDPAFRPQERGHQQLERQKKDIFNFTLFFLCSEMFLLRRQILGEQGGTERSPGALSMARAELWPRRAAAKTLLSFSPSTRSFWG